MGRCTVEDAIQLLEGNHCCGRTGVIRTRYAGGFLYQA